MQFILSMLICVTAAETSGNGVDKAMEKKWDKNVTFTFYNLASFARVILE